MAETITDPGYTEHDAARFVPEEHGGRRTAFQRDRARVIHSSAWRRLAAKTQVLSPQVGIDFARNRLTHSLEVAQIGRELAVALGAAADVVDTACLNHDLGHPPFGHNGETALAAWCADAGGFEGNAQTLRVVARLEGKVFDAQGESRGINLTRAALDASCKYPWERLDESGNVRKKFGYYADDLEIFNWLRDGAVSGRKSVEAQIMDLSDDIAYSVHDFEDAIAGDFIDPMFLNDRSGHDAVLNKLMTSWSCAELARDDIAQAFERIFSNPLWLPAWQGNRSDFARLKNFTSEMIGRFSKATIAATHEAYTGAYFTRYSAEVVVPADIRAEIAVLKGLAEAFVMQLDKRQPEYEMQNEMLTALCDKLFAYPVEMDPMFYADWEQATDDKTRKRVVCDQVASLTDQSATAWFNRLCRGA